MEYGGKRTLSDVPRWDILLFACLCLSYLGACLYTSDIWTEAAFKMTPILFLFTLSFRSIATNSGSYNRWIRLGLLFCAGGDVLLEIEPIFALGFVAGLVSFLIGHICYVVAFYQGTQKIAILRAVPLYIYALGLFFYLKPKIPSELTWPVLAYALTIGTMGFRALARLGNDNCAVSSQKRAALGAILFILSDSLIAINRFETPIPHAHVYIMITYYLAQFLIAFSSIGGLVCSPPKKTE
eukprot:TRINITY_DN1432_c3_g1_i1.p1 TRINITY_DN1432_c3_g1~~TRINITY_DN1432_c3_g1_i1.p1  ORF type:complete len:240 (-),score=25.62 TRINITY_DN1432_c3_g1_i1:244-963(-)